MPRLRVPSSLQVASGLSLRCRFVEDELLHLLHGMRKALVRRVADTRGSANGSGSGGSAVRPGIQVVMLGALRLCPVLCLVHAPWELREGT